MRTTKREEVIFPVMKLDYNFNVIYCNEPARPMLNNWNTRITGQIPTAVLEKHPQIFIALKDSNTPDLEVDMDGVTVKCSVVPFPEAGYIGIYGYMIEYTEKTKEKVTLAKLN